MLFRQLFDSVSSTYTYVLASGPGRAAAIIDPVREKMEDYLAIFGALDLRPAYAPDTHTHADHITGLGALRDVTGCTTLMGEFTKAECVSRRLRTGDQIEFDGLRLTAPYTQRHTCESFS